ncbi:mitochondrial antiviral-signaling protein-like isoform X2 [Entelurus aequoreus]|uniref:mitochondrial antiviral-signaling protein-like isoform X2 n=1 Tax=Entelurus aequoreus TaxID=161455 RepID=UPI002B1E6BA6|nr:mitochondrial antiviral-signaling protein-like isoform X2 [Entelurus aequoreus]
MSFASDKLYNGYLRTNMPTIVSTVKVREMVVHLPCLTAHDRETIEAKRETCGNGDAMVLLLDCLKRRESWPEHFIKALEMCEHTRIAAEVRAEYDTLRGAHTPDDAHLPVPETDAGLGQAAAPPSPPRPAPNATPPPVTEAQPEASTPAAAPESPPSPDRACLQESAEPETPDPARPVPEETSPSDFLVVLHPDQVSPGEVSAGGAVPTEQSDVTPERPPVQTTDPPVEEVVTLEPEEHSQVRSVPDATQTESTSEGYALPADDTTMALSLPCPLLSAQPPTTYSGNTDCLEISDFALGETSTEPEENPPEEEDVRVHVMHVTQQPSLLDLGGQSVGNGAEPDENPPEEEEARVHVMHVTQQPSLLDLDGQSVGNGAQPPTTYSGNTDRLEISDFAQGETSAEPEENPKEEEEVRVHVTQQPSLLDLDGQSVGNGAEPEENPPEEEEARVHVMLVTQQPSPLDFGGQSVGNGAQPATTYSGNTDRLEISDFAQGETSAETEENPPEEEEARVHVMHVTQQPSLLHLGGQSVGNGDASKDGAAEEPANPSSGRLTANSKYILTALGVGALLMAWKWKH